MRLLSFFVRQLAGGRIPGFEDSKVDRQNFKVNVQPGDLPVSEKLFAAFTSFVSSVKDLGLTAENISARSIMHKM
jgi:hypothetical protein